MSEIAVCAGPPDDFLSLGLALVKDNFKLDPIACIITDTDSRIHEEVRKIFPGIVIKVPVFYIIRTIAQGCRLEASEAAAFADIMYQEGLYEKTGTIPAARNNISEKVAFAIRRGCLPTSLDSHGAMELKSKWNVEVVVVE